MNIMNGQNAWREQDMHNDEDRNAVFEHAVTRSADNVLTAQIKENRICELSVGEGVAVLLGYEAEELQCEPELWFSIVHPSDVARARRAFARVSVGKPITEAYRIYRKNGQMRWIRVSAVASGDSSEGAQQIIGIISDATEMQSPDIPVQQMQLFDEFPCATSLFDMSGRMIYCNKAYAALTGCESVEEAMLTTLQDFIPQRDTDKFKRIILPKIMSRPWSGMIEIVRRDGSIRDLCIWTNLLRGADDAPIAVYAIYNDTTEHKRGVENILDSEEKYRVLFERSNDGVVVIQDTILKLVNQQFSEMSGYPVKQLLNTKFTDYLTPEEIAVLHDNYERRMRGEDLPSIYETVMTRSDGSKIELEINAGVITFEGRPADLVLFRDIRDRKRTERALRENEERLRALTEISQEFVSTYNTDKIISAAIQSTARLLDCLCSVLRIDPGTGRLHHVSLHCEDREFAQRTETALRDVELTVEDVFGPEGIRAAIDPDSKQRSAQAAKFRRKSGIGPSLVVPLYIEGQVMGLLAGGRRQGEPPFNDDDFWFFSEVASHASSALTNASLYKRQTRIAETLQRSLIPPEPTVPGLDIATSYFPAKGEAEVGGDFFDIIDFKDGRVGVVIGDVSGKGVDAAIHTAESKYMLRGYALQNPDPGYVMSALNQALWSFTAEFTFVTMFYALIDPANRTMTYVNAGHEFPLILCRRKKRVQGLTSDGLILGVIKDQDYVTHRAELADDDLLFCYTDGVIDVPCNGDRFGYDRLVDVVRHAASTTPQELLDYVSSAVRKFSKGNQPDDQVIVVVRLKDR